MSTERVLQSLILVLEFLGSSKDLSDYGVNELINEYSILSSIWKNLTSPIFIIQIRVVIKNLVESSNIIYSMRISIGFSFLF